MTTTSLYVSSAGAGARLHQLDIVANNLANIDTTGFKADQTTFRAALEAALLDPEAEPVRGAPMHSFVATGGPATHHGSGASTRTGRGLDVAIDGPGFFRVETPSGTRYTRAGSFRVDEKGGLVTPAGHAVLGSGGPIRVGASDPRIEADGRIVGSQGNALGQLALEIFEDPQLLEKEGRSLFRAPDLAARSAEPRVSLLPGSLETSNVEPTLELARMVMLQRAYDASMQALEADDSASRRLIQEVSS